MAYTLDDLGSPEMARSLRAEAAALFGSGPACGLSRAARRDRRLEKVVQADIVRFAQALGHHGTDTSQPRASIVMPGLPDLLLMGHGAADWVEVKTACGRMTAAQHAWHEAARAAGQRVVVCSEADLAETRRAPGAPVT
ncbi:MAG TPA: VRR-NUC domain-containing protein [Rubricoccaceae bacterium]|jgi:hypothetical protein